MNDIEIKLLNAKLYLNYYKNNNILDRYATIIERLVIDNDCLSVLKNPNEKLYITPLSKNVNKEEKYKDLEQIEKEHKEENGRLREELSQYKRIDKLVSNITPEEVDTAIKRAGEQFIEVSKIEKELIQLNKDEKKELKGMKGQDRYFVKQQYAAKRKILEKVLKMKGR